MSLWVNRPRRGGLWAVLAALSLALLGLAVRSRFGGTCSTSLMLRITSAIKIYSRVFRKEAVRTVRIAAASAKPQIFTGEEVSPVEGASSRSAADGERAGLRTKF